MATPALSALRRRFGQSHITWMGPSAALDVLAGLKLSDEVIADVSKGCSLGGLLAGRRNLRAGRFDLAVLFSNAFRVAMVCRLGNVARLVGYARDGRGWLLTQGMPPPRRQDGSLLPTPAIRYYLALAELLGCDVSDRRMRLVVEDSYATEAESVFRQAGIGPSDTVVLINPGASFGSSKLWLPARFSAVADALADRYGIRIVINASPAEQAIAAAVGDGMRRGPAINFTRRYNTLGLLKAITARSRLVITGDTGPRHIAAALGVAVVTIFTSTDPSWTTIDYDRERIVRADVSCSPCQRKVCPIPRKSEEYHQCAAQIRADMVLSAAEELLASPPVCPPSGGPVA